jgi:hypothetical protein
VKRRFSFLKKLFALQNRYSLVFLLFFTKKKSYRNFLFSFYYFFRKSSTKLANSDFAKQKVSLEKALCEHPCKAGISVAVQIASWDMPPATLCFIYSNLSARPE